jgi:hypothetical protein
MAARQLLQGTEVAPHQCFLLRPRPTFDLPLDRDLVGKPLKPLREDEYDRPPLRGKAAKISGIVLGDPPF